jgi:hypothetical protein
VDYRDCLETRIVRHGAGYRIDCENTPTDLATIVLDLAAEWTGAPEFVDRVPVPIANWMVSTTAIYETLSRGIEPDPTVPLYSDWRAFISCRHLRPPSPSQRLALALMHCHEIQALLEDVRAEHGIEPVPPWTLRDDHQVFYGLDTTPQIG